MVHSFKHNGIEYLYNDENKTALILKCVNRLSVNQFSKKTIKRAKNKNDKYNRCTTVDVVKNAITLFLNHVDYSCYELVVPVGTVDHECCVFFSKNGNTFQSIYYNPNYSLIHDGVESSALANALLKEMGQNLRSIRSYYSLSGNVDDECSGFVWEEIFNFIKNGNSPFGNDSLNLEDYNHFTTQKTYDRYRYKKTENIKLKYLRYWKRYDQMLGDIDTTDAIKISNKMSRIISDYYKQKKSSSA